jgi:hypothetical protein
MFRSQGDAHEHIVALNPVKLDTADHNFFMDEAHRREDLNHDEDFVDRNDDPDGDSVSSGDGSSDELDDWISDDDNVESSAEEGGSDGSVEDGDDSSN